MPFDLAPQDVAIFSGKNSESPAELALTCGAQRRITLLFVGSLLKTVKVGTETIAIFRLRKYSA
jgi:hypothetical protein